jgi:hypothetical protein
VRVDGAVDVNLLERLGRALDPRGPIGAILSPADVYKESGPIPTGKAYVAVAKPGVSEDMRARVEATLAPERFVSVDDVGGRVARTVVLNRFVEEHWEPVYAPVQGETFEEVMAGALSRTPAGWRVTQHARSATCDCSKPRLELHRGELRHVACGRPSAVKADVNNIAEHVASLGIQARDDFYNGVYPTLGGKNANDRQANIIGGRTEYKARTKGMIEWGSTRNDIEETSRALRKIDAERQAKKKNAVNLIAEKWSKSAPRKLGEL